MDSCVTLLGSRRLAGPASRASPREVSSGACSRSIASSARVISWCPAATITRQPRVSSAGPSWRPSTGSPTTSTSSPPATRARRSSSSTTPAPWRRPCRSPSSPSGRAGSPASSPGSACERGDRVLVMLPNVAPLWETMLGATRLGAVVIPATTQLTSADVDDRLERGAVRCAVVESAVTDRFGGERPGARARRRRRPTSPAWTGFDDAYGHDGCRRGSPRGAHARPTIRCCSTSRRARRRSPSSCSTPTRAIRSATCRRCTGSASARATCTRTSARRAGPSTPGRACSRRGTPARRWSCTTTRASRPQAHARAAGARARVDHAVRAADGVAHARAREPRRAAASAARARQRRRAAQPRGHRGGPRGVEAHGPRRLRSDRDDGADRQLARADASAGLDGPAAARLRRRAARCGAAPSATRARSRSRSRRGRPASWRLPRRSRQRTAAATAGGYYRTGDEACRDADGYIHFVGRGDDVFKSSDYRISPFELESVLVEHPAVAEAAVVPSPDPLRLAVPKAFVALAPGHEPHARSPATIFEFVRAPPGAVQAHPAARVRGAAQDDLGQDPARRAAPARGRSSGRGASAASTSWRGTTSAKHVRVDRWPSSPVRATRRAVG